MKTPEKRRLPSGKYTTSTKRYVTAWRKLGNAIGKVVGETCFAYDQGLTFSGRFGIHSACHAIKLYEAITGRTWID